MIQNKDPASAWLTQTLSQGPWQVNLSPARLASTVRQSQAETWRNTKAKSFILHFSPCAECNRHTEDVEPWRGRASEALCHGAFQYCFVQARGWRQPTCHDANGDGVKRATRLHHSLAGMAPTLAWVALWPGPLEAPCPQSLRLICDSPTTNSAGHEGTFARFVKPVDSALSHRLVSCRGPFTGSSTLIRARRLRGTGTRFPA